jgi:dTDP-glucose 4,6-dehydratase
MKKKIIVTGGLGFIGSNLINLLIEQNYSIINIDRISYSSNFYNNRDVQYSKNYKFIKCDINNKDKILKIFLKYRPECIFNLAAETHVDRSIDSPKDFINNNILGVFKLLEAFRKYNKKNKKTRLIHISTDEVYGDILRGRSDENYAYKPSSPYAASKAASDHLVYSYIRTFKIPAIVTNCSNNYGPKQHPEKLIPKMIYNIINNKSLPIYGKGENSREWIYVTDHCEALIRIYKKGKLGEFYNIGSNKNLNNIQITKMLLRIANKHMKIGSKVKIEYVKDRPGHDLRYALNSNKLKKKLGWKSTTSIDKGLKKTFLWYLNNRAYFNKIKKKDIIDRLGN